MLGGKQDEQRTQSRTAIDFAHRYLTCSYKLIALLPLGGLGLGGYVSTWAIAMQQSRVTQVSGLVGCTGRLVWAPLACVLFMCMCVRSGHSLEVGTMAFLCSELQVAVETQSQTKPCWHTERQGPRVLLPPSGDMGQNRAIVPEQLGAINAQQPRSMTNTNKCTNRTAVTFSVALFSQPQSQRKHEPLISDHDLKKREKNKIFWVLF